MDTSKARSEAYVRRDGRLEDVITLIQVLGLGATVSPSERGLRARDVLGDKPPRSGDSWLEVAKEHPEFFRVYEGEGDPVVRLAVRFALPRDKRDEFPPEVVNGLIDAAIRLHNAQLQRRQVLRVAWAGGILLALSALASILSSVVSVLQYFGVH